MISIKSLYDPSLGKVETLQGTLKLSEIFVPTFLELFLMNLMNTVNTFTLSYYSDHAVAAVGSAGQFIGMIITFYTVVSTGTSIYMGQKIGAGSINEASEAAFSSILFVGLFSAVISTIISVNSTFMMSLMNISGDVLEQASTYLRITIQFSFIVAINSVVYAIFKSCGKPKISVMIGFIMNVINAFLNYLIIFRPISIPLHGISGIATSYVISESIAFLIALTILIKLPLGLHFSKITLHSITILKHILGIGVPGGISSLSYTVSQVVTTAIIATLGVTAISTKIYVSNLVYYVYVTGMSLGLTTSLMISWLCGAGKYQQAYKLNIQNLRIAVLLNLLFSSLLFFFGSSLLGLFTNDAEILTIGKMLLGIDIFVEAFRGINHIEENSLRGSGDVLYPMKVSIISCWLMSVLFCYVLGIHFRLGLAGCWIAFCLDEMFRGILYFRRWHSRKWISKTVK